MPNHSDSGTPCFSTPDLHSHFSLQFLQICGFVFNILSFCFDNMC